MSYRTLGSLSPSASISKIYPIDRGYMLTMQGKACRTLKAAEELAKGVKHASAISLDVKNTGALEAEVGKHDLVIR